MTPDDDVILANEARYFHLALFKTAAPPEVVARYVAGSRLCCSETPRPVRQLIDAMIARRLDVEAIEYVLRLRESENILTKKLQILFYLIEVRSEYYEHFVNRRNAFLPAWTALILSALRTPYQFCKGWIQLWWAGKCTTR